jgi:hypothetical protein
MKLAIQISTGKYINDFQEKATAAGLIANALKSGIEENDIEIVEVTKEEYKTIVETETAAAKAETELADKAIEDKTKADGVAVFNKLKLSPQEIKDLVVFIREVDLDTL